MITNEDIVKLIAKGDYSRLGIELGLSIGRENKLCQLISDLKEDGDRFASVMAWKGETGHWYCDGCNNNGEYEEDIQHASDCPITLHAKLYAKIEKAGI